MLIKSINKLINIPFYIKITHKGKIINTHQIILNQTKTIVNQANNSHYS
jgi:hypothetical protein